MSNSMFTEIQNWPSIPVEDEFDKALRDRAEAAAQTTEVINPWAGAPNTDPRDEAVHAALTQRTFFSAPSVWTTPEGNSNR